MTIADEISREVVFTDYGCSDKARIEVVVSKTGSGAIANIRMPAFPSASFVGCDDIGEPDVLRSYAHCLLKAADEMEAMK